MGGGGSKPSGPPPPPPPPPFNPPPPKNFQKGSPPENMKLTIGGSASCPSCRIGIEADFSSSVVILSRDIMGKIPAPPPKAQSDSWVWDNFVGIDGNGLPYLVEWDPEIRRRCVNTCKYKRANPEVFGMKQISGGDAGEKVDIGPDGTIMLSFKSADGFTNAYNVEQHFADDLAAWKADQNASRAKGETKRGNMVYMWNPSDDPKDPNGSIAVNYQNHGALTKLFIKPTLPFTVTFSE